MFARAIAPSQARHARLFELLRQSNRAEMARACHPAPALSPHAAEAFMRYAARSLG